MGFQEHKELPPPPPAGAGLRRQPSTEDSRGQQRQRQKVHGGRSPASLGQGASWEAMGFGQVTSAPPFPAPASVKAGVGLCGDGRDCPRGPVTVPGPADVGPTAYASGDGGERQMGGKGEGRLGGSGAM